MSNSAILTFSAAGRDPVHVYHQWLDERLMRNAFRACVRDHVRFDHVPEAYIAHRYAYEARFRRIRIKASHQWPDITCPHIIDHPTLVITDNGRIFVQSEFDHETRSTLITVKFPGQPAEHFPKKRNP